MRPSNIVAFLSTAVGYASAINRTAIALDFPSLGHLFKICDTFTGRGLQNGTECAPRYDNDTLEHVWLFTFANFSETTNATEGCTDDLTWFRHEGQLELVPTWDMWDGHHTSQTGWNYE